MKIKKDEVSLLILMYLLCMALFFNLAILKDSMDKSAIYMGLVVCGLLTATQVLIRKFYPGGDKFLITFACILSVIGMAVIYRLDMNVAVKQFIWFTMGIIVFIVSVVVLPEVKELGKFKKVFLIATIVIMPLALIADQEVNGATNWVKIAGFSFQPSELAKITYVLYLASSLQQYKDKGNMIEDFKQLWEPLLLVMYCLGCLVLQKDLGSALIFFGIALTLLYVSTGKKRYVLITLIMFIAGAFLAYHMFSHVKLRVDVWRDPWKYKNSGGYQIVQGLYAISSGGILGSGLGEGYPGFIPVNTTDFIFAVLCEELGMAFGLAVMIIYFLFFYRGMRASFIVKDKFAQLSTVGFSATIACQVLVIIGGVFAVIPLTGITLPLISYGGSSMLSTFFLLALLQKISEEG